MIVDDNIFSEHKETPDKLLIEQPRRYSSSSLMLSSAPQTPNHATNRANLRATSSSDLASSTQDLTAT